MIRKALLAVAVVSCVPAAGFAAPFRENDVGIGRESRSTLTVYGVDAAERAVSDSLLAPLGSEVPTPGRISRESDLGSVETAPTGSGGAANGLDARSAGDARDDRPTGWNGARGQPPGRTSGQSIHDVLRGLVNVSTTAAQGGNPGRNGVNGQAVAARRVGGTGHVSLADQFLVEILESILAPILGDDGTIGFSVLGFGQFQVEFSGEADAPIIHVIEHTSGLEFTRVPSGEPRIDPERGEFREASYVVDYRMSVRDILLEIFFSVVYSPFLYILIACGAVFFFHRWLRRA